MRRERRRKSMGWRERRKSRGGRRGGRKGGRGRKEDVEEGLW